MLAVVGCGAKESKIGETINVDGVEFTLTNFELANRVGYKKSTAFGVLDESAEYYYKANYNQYKLIQLLKLKNKLKLKI